GGRRFSAHHADGGEAWRGHRYLRRSPHGDELLPGGHRGGPCEDQEPAVREENLPGLLQYAVEYHSITRSARSSIEVGIARPICRAVLRFTTNSNLLACSMGNSAGLAPL